MDVTMKKQKSVMILLWLLLLTCVFYFVSYGLFVYGATLGESVSAGQVCYTLYAYGGFTIICFVGLFITALSGAKRKAFAARVLIWGIILLAYHFAAQFFANAFNLVLMTFQQGLIYASEYIPSLFLTAALIAILCQWNAEDKKIANRVCWVGLLVSAFLSGWFIYYKLTSLALADAAVIYEALFGIAHALVIPIALGLLFAATRNEEAFQRVFCSKIK